MNTLSRTTWLLSKPPIFRCILAILFLFFHLLCLLGCSLVFCQRCNAVVRTRQILMEIDLNHALESEVEKNACGCNGECDKGGGCAYCSLSTSTSSCSSNGSSSNPPAPSKIFKELWYACAGPVTNLPKKGNVVVYFPQGHLEQAASVSSFPVLDVPTFDLQPQIFCRVLDVELLVSNGLPLFDWTPYAVFW